MNRVHEHNRVVARERQPHRLHRKVRLAAGLAAVAVLPAVGIVESSDDAEVGGDLSAYVNTEQQLGLEPLIPAFEEASGASLDVESAPTPDLNEQLRVQLTSGTAADVFRVSPGYSSPVAVGILGGQGELADLSEAAWVDSMSDSMSELASVDGQVFGFPIGQNALVMVYNKEVFDAAGVEPPETWSELIEACDQLEASGVTPIAAGFTGGVFLQFWPYALAASLVYGPDPGVSQQMLDDEVDFVDYEGWTTVFEKFLELEPYMTEDANGVSPDQSTLDLAQGNAAMQLMASAGMPGLFAQNEQGADAFGVFALPATDDPADTRLPIAPDFLAVNAATENEATAKALFDFLAEPENVKTYAETLEVLPGLEVVDDVQLPSLEPVLPYIEDGRTTAYANYLWPNGDTQQRLLQSGQELLVGDIDIPELLGQLDTEFDKGTPTS